VIKTILLSLLALLAVYYVAHSRGLTPEQAEDRILLAELNAEEGEAYRAANRRRPGVVTLTSGLQVEVLRHGEGEIPDDGDRVEVDYVGWRIDGRELQGSRRRDEPATVAVARTIPGWREALVAIPVGSRVRLVLPPALAYGRAGGGLIGPEETLVFELDLLGIVSPDTVPERDELQQRVPNLR
jgi:FKBP-type peptidyl-prolyl cis-trans isomerase FkpA